MELQRQDWDQFLSATPWFVQDGQTVDVGIPAAWDRGGIDGLPALSALLAEATRTPVSVDGTSYELLAWGPADQRRGWLCHPPQEVGDRVVTDVHRRFWAVCGGIVEMFGAPSSRWDNHDEVLTAAASDIAIGEALYAYAWIWEQAGQSVPIDPADFYALGVEANGNLTLAHRKDGGLLLFAPDHSFDGITPFAGSPDYSLYTVDEAPDLSAWVETAARMCLR